MSKAMTDDELRKQVEVLLIAFGERVRRQHSTGMGWRGLEPTTDIMQLIQARDEQREIDIRIDEQKKLLHKGVCEYMIGWAKVCEKQDDCPAIRKRIKQLQALKGSQDEK